MIERTHIEQFLAADTATRFRLMRDDAFATEVREYMGEGPYAEYHQLVPPVEKGAHLAYKPEKNVIFVPGIMGSILQSKTLPGTWWIDVRSRHRLKDLRLSPDGTEDADRTHAVWASGIDQIYEPFMTALLQSEYWSHEQFPYDWRKPIHLAAADLATRIEQLYEANGREPIHLAAHSMGGMVVRGMLAKANDELWKKIGRIVFMATPHYGAPAVAGYLKNHLWGFELMAVLGLYLDEPALRSFWGFLSLLPAPSGLYPTTRPNDVKLTNANQNVLWYDHPGASFDMYDAKAWGLDLDSVALGQLQTILDHVRGFHQTLADSHRDLKPAYRDRMLVIAGVGYKTLFRLEENNAFLGLWQGVRKITAREAGTPDRDGDGRVPLRSALLDDVSTVFVRGIHAQIPNLETVQQAVMNWFAGKTVDLPTTPEGALGRHLAGSEGTPVPHLDGSARAVGDDPGYWHDELSPSVIAALRARVDAGDLRDFNFVRLF